MSVLKTEHITMRFGGVTAVDDVSLHVDQGEIVAIIGPNGAGKTTAFNMITGVYKPTSGQVLFQDSAGLMQDITGLRPDMITALGAARTYQNIRLFRSMTVLENVLIAEHLHLKSGLVHAVTGIPKFSNLMGAVTRSIRYSNEEKLLREHAMALLERVGLSHAANEIATSLPYGEQRRLEIARALATKPKLLLLDEPAAGMNPKETEDLTSFVMDLRNELQLTIMLIEHHMQIVMDISDRIYVLDYGKLIAQGSPEDIQNNPDVIAAYLGVEEA